jgi:hypothetical protein
LEGVDDPAPQIRGIQRQGRFGQSLSALTVNNRNIFPAGGNFTKNGLWQFPRLEDKAAFSRQRRGGS